MRLSQSGRGGHSEAVCTAVVGWRLEPGAMPGFAGGQKKWKVLSSDRTFHSRITCRNVDTTSCGLNHRFSPAARRHLSDAKGRASLRSLRYFFFFAAFFFAGFFAAFFFAAFFFAIMCHLLLADKNPFLFLRQHVNNKCRFNLQNHIEQIIQDTNFPFIIFYRPEVYKYLTNFFPTPFTRLHILFIIHCCKAHRIGFA